MAQISLAILGGSGVATPALVQALLDWTGYVQDRPELRTLLYSLALYEELATHAIVEENRDVALRSLLAHPLIRSIEQAQAVLKAVWPTGGFSMLQ